MVRCEVKFRVVGVASSTNYCRVMNLDEPTEDCAINTLRRQDSVPTDRDVKIISLIILS